MHEEYTRFLDLMREEAGDYLERTLALMELPWEEFAQLFQTVGEVLVLLEGEERVGFCWLERRDEVLHLHAIVIQESHRGQGIGTRTLQLLEGRYRGTVKSIELGVHGTNAGAQQLYRRLGYERVRLLEELNFEILQKQLAE
jgi:ribosomal protein S18 acetylase RimI-like enzyme